MLEFLESKKENVTFKSMWGESLDFIVFFFILSLCNQLSNKSQLCEQMQLMSAQTINFSVMASHGYNLPQIILCITFIRIMVYACKINQV